MRSTYQQPKIAGSRKNRATSALRQLTAKMQLLLVPFERAPNKGPLNYRLLVKLGLLTEEQAASLEVDAEYVMVSKPPARVDGSFLAEGRTSSSLS